MADNRTMAELLQAPTEGYEDAIIIPEIAANNFELKHDLINLVQNKQFFRHDKEDPHAQIRYFNKITSTTRVPNVPSSSIKLMLFPFSLEGTSQIWLEKEPPRSIQTWDDLVSKFINQACPHHRFFELHQFDTFYNALNVNDHDSLNSAAGGNFLDKMPRECLKIIESKSKVRQSRAKAVVAKVGTSSSTLAISSEVAKLKDLVRALLLDKKNQSSAPVSSPTPAPVKEVEPNYVTCGDLGASINLIPFSMWEALSHPKLTPTYMTLELADHMISKPIGVAKDVSFKVGVFHFLADFMVVDFEPELRVPLILGRCFLKTGRALIDVHKGELILRIENEAITNNLDQTVRYSANYNQMTANKINIIEMACEEYSQEVLSFSDVTASGNPTLHDDPIVSTTSPTLTPFGDSDFLLFEEADAFLGLEDDMNSPKINPFYCDPEGDILLLEAILNTKTVKSSVDEPPEIELKDLPPHLEYAFLEGDNKLPVNIAKELGDEEKSTLIKVLKSHKQVIAWKQSDIQGGFTVVENEENELILTRLVSGWRVCIDYHKLNEATRKDHFPLPFMAQMLDRLAKNEFYCFLDGFFGYFQIPIDPRDQEKITFTCPYGTFAYRRMPFGLCNAPGTFQRCMLAIFHDMVEKTMEVFMDDFSIFGNSFENCLSRLDKIAKVDVIAKLPHPTTVKGVRSFLGHAGFYRRFIQDFSKISRPMTHLLEKNTPFIFFEDCIKAFQTLKKKLTEAPILIAPNWDLPFELMCDARDFAIGAENLAADHLSRLENPYENMLDPKGINETFPLETLSMVTFCGDSSAPWFANFANYHAAKALPTNDACVVCKFLKSLFARFGAPRAIISDRGTHFCNDQFGKVMLKYGVTHRLSTTYHPQTSGQVEVSNCGLKRILERTIGENQASWLDKLDDALWAFRTAYKTPIGCTPYKIVYGKACHLPIELEHKAYWALKQANFDLAVAGDHQKIQLIKLNEISDHAYENSLIYKEKTKRIHNSKIKNRVFNIGDRVLFNSRLKIFSGKLKTRWSGSFTIAKVFPYGTIELSQANEPNFKMNGHRVKHYFGRDVPQLDYLDCEVLRAFSFSFTIALLPQLHFGSPVSKSYRLTFSFGIPNKWP
uniref:DNA-directed DNA polymerase n=1 Tax=Tanacetum cinerariifolium TaxID=118510 RepID=A0A699I5T1_TANCI|nr:DNA-directed DNA polymerase [Tanacetum cinerariifolium]